MKQTVFLFLGLAILVCIACRKGNTLDPVIRLSSEPGFLRANTILTIGTTASLRLYAESDGEDILAHLTVRKNDEIMLDSMIRRKNLSFDIQITKDPSVEETWEFLVRDEGGEEASVAITLYARAGVQGFSSPPVEAQRSAGQRFYSVIHNKVYLQENASLKPDSIDLMYYFNAGSQSASLIAASNRIADTVYTGTTAPVNWLTRNNTLFLPATNLSAGMVDTLSTDWFLFYAFQRKKSEWTNQSIALSTDVLSYFRLASGEYGVCRVLSVDKSTTGSIVLQVRMQKFE